MKFSTKISVNQKGNSSENFREWVLQRSVTVINFVTVTSHKFWPKSHFYKQSSTLTLALIYIDTHEKNGILKLVLHTQQLHTNR